jgi:hypothetical protein
VSELYCGALRRIDESHSKEYNTAFVEHLLRKLCGVVALASCLPRDLTWASNLLDAARGSSLIKSRSALFAALRFAALWDPQSHRSSLDHGNTARCLLLGFVGPKAERWAARESLHQAASRVLEWKDDCINSVNGSSARERAWVARAATK